MSVKNSQRSIKVEKNVPNWQPSAHDYVLVFLECQDPDGSLVWRECSANIHQYSRMLLADYLSLMGMQIPDYTQFLRVIDEERGLHFEYKVYGGRVTIYVTIRE